MKTRKFQIIEVTEGALDAGLEPPTPRDLRKSEIIQAASDVFAEDGYAAFSTRSVARKVGVALSTIQHYFPTREILVVETIRHQMLGYIEPYRALTTSKELPPLERLSVFIDDLIGEIRRPEVAAFFFQMWALAQHEPSIGALVEALYEEYRSLIKQLALEINPSLDDESASAAALLMASQTEGIIIFTHRGGGYLPSWERIASSAKQAWMDMCQVRSGPSDAPH